ncbi:unnamed protein product, partial [Ectocarpus sp. 13 AM-2016]
MDTVAGGGCGSRSLKALRMPRGGAATASATDGPSSSGRIEQERSSFSSSASSSSPSPSSPPLSLLSASSAAGSPVASSQSSHVPSGFGRRSQNSAVHGGSRSRPCSDTYAVGEGKHSTDRPTAAAAGCGGGTPSVPPTTGDSAVAMASSAS